MNSEGKTRKKLISEGFFRLMIASTFMYVATNINGLVDGMFTGRVLGNNALAAMGFFVPVMTAISLTNMLVLGTQILCGNLIGSGQKEKIDALFFSTLVTLTSIGVGFSVLLIIFRSPLALLLGAEGEIKVLLTAYIAGYAPGVVFQIISSLFSSLAAFNNDIRRSYIAIAVMIISNIAGNWIFSKPLGLAGIGLSSTVSFALSALILTAGFMKKNRVLTIKKAPFNGNLLSNAFSMGVPLALILLGVVVKNYLCNYSVSHYAGTDGVAVVNIMSQMINLAGGLPAGVWGAYITLAGLYSGEDDRESFLELMRVSLRLGVSSCVILTVIIMIFSQSLSVLFLGPGNPTLPMSVRMFLLAPLYLAPNALLCLLLKAYQLQGKLLFVNIMSFLEPSLAGVLCIAAVPFFGTDAAWLSDCIINLSMILAVLIMIWIKAGKISFDLNLLLMLPDSFGAPEGSFMEFSISDPKEVTARSEETVSFCRSRGSGSKEAYLAGLCLEETANNILTHGFKGNEKHSLDIRVVKRDSLSLRFRDDCREFDPKQRIDSMTPDSPEDKIGLRLVAAGASEIFYYNNAGINTLLLKI